MCPARNTGLALWQWGAVLGKADFGLSASEACLLQAILMSSQTAFSMFVTSTTTELKAAIQQEFARGVRVSALLSLLEPARVVMSVRLQARV